MEIISTEQREPERIEAKDLDGKLTALEKEIEQVFIDGWNQTKGRQCLSVREIWEKLGRSPSIGHQGNGKTGIHSSDGKDRGLLNKWLPAADADPLDK